MSCARTGAVEALQDGRLGLEQAEALRSHVAACVECGAAVQRLADLKAALRALAPNEADEVRVLAGRRRLLVAAETVRARPRWAGSGWVLLAAGAALALGLFALAAWREKLGGTGRAEPGFEVSVVPFDGAAWTRATTPSAETLTLGDGGLRVAVKRHDASHRVLVELPDGELEDVGTVFSVRVAAGRTREVAVREGEVALRLRGLPEQRLRAGESYRAPEPEPAGSNPSVATSASAPAVDPDAAPPAERKASAGRTSRTDARGADESGGCAEASLFGDGVQAFKRGDYASATSTLERFMAACPGTGHAEDAAYVRMVALARAGRTDEARAQALAYLKRFPSGFRLKEAERLAGAP